MKKFKEILKSQKGQGVWEYMIILVGIGAVALLVTTALGDGLTKTGGTTETVVNQVESLIDKAAGDEITPP